MIKLFLDPSPYILKIAVWIELLLQNYLSQTNRLLVHVRMQTLSEASQFPPLAPKHAITVTPSFSLPSLTSNTFSVPLGTMTRP